MDRSELDAIKEEIGFWEFPPNWLYQVIQAGQFAFYYWGCHMSGGLAVVLALGLTLLNLMLTAVILSISDIIKIRNYYKD